MSVVSITRLRVRSWSLLPVFFFHAFLSVWQARKAAGLLAATLLKDKWRTYWTCTIWTDEAAMKAFMVSGSHRKAMPELLELCDEASVARWTQEGADLPPWTEVHRRMQQDGRPSKVNHPSAAHSRYEIPSPRVLRYLDIRLK